jgi:hypothetical protein
MSSAPSARAERLPTGKTDIIKVMGNTKWGDIELK